jgi:hypothetical protein
MEGKLLIRQYPYYAGGSYAKAITKNFIWKQSKWKKEKNTFIAATVWGTARSIWACNGAGVAFDDHDDDSKHQVTASALFWPFLVQNSQVRARFRRPLVNGISGFELVLTW